MKLREKFKTEFSINTSGESGRFADKCEKISDEFAIGFAEWMLGNNNEYSFINSKDPLEIIKQLLQIYKKEKDL